MSTREQFRRSSEALIRRQNDSAATGNVTLSRSAISLFTALGG